MKKGIFAIFGALIILAVSFYQLWSIDQPKVGPVGDGIIPDYAYTSIYIGIYVGAGSFILGVLHIILESMKNKK
ncbi:hypothetical protein MUG84_03460 [Paenibacillus sp. KQZ6P-2]|uniref:Uncharacterized protein n=1 Tax=Paenibacillus mangrovi TaxID=2931978 RepID=A0A9X2B101_9BACL|nr:hypothetical protein [Paenibacillus mangrovi]MCJ8010801.1 hypothetical protein [Paenibacillus mangrovi]